MRLGYLTTSLYLFVGLGGTSYRKYKKYEDQKQKAADRKKGLVRNGAIIPTFPRRYKERQGFTIVTKTKECLQRTDITSEGITKALALATFYHIQVHNRSLLQRPSLSGQRRYYSSLSNNLKSNIHVSVTRNNSSQLNVFSECVGKNNGERVGRFHVGSRAPALLGKLAEENKKLSKKNEPNMPLEAKSQPPTEVILWNVPHLVKNKELGHYLNQVAGYCINHSSIQILESGIGEQKRIKLVFDNDEKAQKLVQSLKLKQNHKLIIEKQRVGDKISEIHGSDIVKRKRPKQNYNMADTIIIKRLRYKSDKKIFEMIKNCFKVSIRAITMRPQHNNASAVVSFFTVDDARYVLGNFNSNTVSCQKFALLNNNHLAIAELFKGRAMHKTVKQKEEHASDVRFQKSASKKEAQKLSQIVETIRSKEAKITLESQNKIEPVTKTVMVKPRTTQVREVRMETAEHALSVFFMDPKFDVALAKPREPECQPTLEKDKNNNNNSEYVKWLHSDEGKPKLNHHTWMRCKREDTPESMIQIVVDLHNKYLKSGNNPIQERHLSSLVRYTSSVWESRIQLGYRILPIPEWVLTDALRVSNYIFHHSIRINIRYFISMFKLLRSVSPSKWLHLYVRARRYIHTETTSVAVLTKGFSSTSDLHEYSSKRTYYERKRFDVTSFISKLYVSVLAVSGQSHLQEKTENWQKIYKNIPNVIQRDFVSLGMLPMKTHAWQAYCATCDAGLLQEAISRVDWRNSIHNSALCHTWLVPLNAKAMTFLLQATRCVEDLQIVRDLVSHFRIKLTVFSYKALRNSVVNLWKEPDLVIVKQCDDIIKNKTFDVDLPHWHNNTYGEPYVWLTGSGKPLEGFSR